MDSVLSLRAAIEYKSFWTMPDADFLDIIKSQFSQELERLKNAYSVRNASPLPSPSIAEQLYGQDYPEINRALVGVLALRWIRNGEFETFTKTQEPGTTLLRQESFGWLREVFEGGLRTNDDVFTLITSMVTNDLGKDPDLATDCGKKTGIDIPEVNHDMVLYHAAKAGLVPSLDRLSKEDRDDLLLGIELGAEFNFGQLAQAESAPASLAGLVKMRGHDRAFTMKFMEQILDLAGAAGHEDWTCAKKMTESVFQSYKNVFDVAESVIKDDVPLRVAYDLILTRKLQMLHELGYDKALYIEQAVDRALLRLFCLGNITDRPQANFYSRVFEEVLESKTRQKLIYGLNVDGSIKEPAIQVTYMPTMLAKALRAHAESSIERNEEAFVAMLRYLARCLVVTESDLAELPQGVVVIERDARKLIPVLDSSGFQHNPAILDQETVPGCQVANVASGQ